MENLEKKFLEATKILPNVRNSLDEIGFPQDEDRRALIEHHVERLASQFIEAKDLKTLTEFFEGNTGKQWIKTELHLLQEIEKIILAHISLAKGDQLLGELGLDLESPTNQSDITDLPPN